MIINKNGQKVYITASLAEYKKLEAQGFMGNSSVFDEPGVEEEFSHQEGGDGIPKVPHDPFMHDIEKIFHKHGRELTPELREHLNPTDDTFSHDTRDYADPTSAPMANDADTGGTWNESYQDNSDPAKPYGGGQLGVIPSVGGMMGSPIASSKESIKIASRKGISKIGNSSDFMNRLIEKLKGNKNG